jgi:hypothetical protein
MGKWEAITRNLRYLQFFIMYVISVGLESREYGLRDPSRWPRGTIYPQKFVLTLPTSSVGIVRSRTQATEFLMYNIWGLKLSFRNVVFYSQCNRIDEAQRPVVLTLCLLPTLLHSWNRPEFPSSKGFGKSMMLYELVAPISLFCSLGEEERRSEEK